MQLLSVGRSLCGIRDEPSRYKMTQDNLLPKFGLAKESDRTDAHQPPARSARRTVVEPAKPEAKPGLDREEMNNTSHLMMEKTDAPASSAPPGQAPIQAFPRGRWTVLKNPFAAKPTTSKGPLQYELSIDAIKVVRNDLSDADLEVVPGRNPLAPTPGMAAKRTREGLESIGQAWGRIAARILGLGRTH